MMRVCDGGPGVTCHHVEGGRVDLILLQLHAFLDGPQNEDGRRFRWWVIVIGAQRYVGL